MWVTALRQKYRMIVGYPPYYGNFAPSSCDMARDTVAWNLTPTGSFFVASAYECVVESTWDAPSSKWSRVWSLPVSQRICLFL
ncbi:hypothetical protein V6N11_058797 [Hibiscus sabdariffa]|uniref:Uncharacterized protein n=1 Tax=Hibiscus sabdariffa TaxID=183260 RepID=A0ABR2U588_9ROSI